MGGINAINNSTANINLAINVIENGYVVSYSGQDNGEYVYRQYYESTPEDAADRVELLLTA